MIKPGKESVSKLHLCVCVCVCRAFWPYAGRGRLASDGPRGRIWQLLQNPVQGVYRLPRERMRLDELLPHLRPLRALAGENPHERGRACGRFGNLGPLGSFRSVRHTECPMVVTVSPRRQRVGYIPHSIYVPAQVVVEPPGAVFGRLLVFG